MCTNPDPLGAQYSPVIPISKLSTKSIRDSAASAGVTAIQKVSLKVPVQLREHYVETYLHRRRTSKFRVSYTQHQLIRFIQKLPERRNKVCDITIIIRRSPALAYPTAQRKNRRWTTYELIEPHSFCHLRPHKARLFSHQRVPSPKSPDKGYPHAPSPLRSPYPSDPDSTASPPYSTPPC